ncbi:MAG: PEPxxWA-CTERM sorting domain-containing protein [Sphingopyxis sp.]|nr:PEPxxWA-CTERM sorting domain-containing protein [Sphingopyxis sp.]
MNQGLVIGARYSKDTQFVKGSIDNVRISNVALSGNQLGFFSDGVSAVPEPTTWAMMLMGFGLIGGVLRSEKRRRKAVPSFG